MKRLIKTVFVLLTLAVMGVGAVAGLFAWIASDLPEINSLADYRPPMNSRILSRDGEVLLDIGKETRDIVAYKEMPQMIVSAFLAAEDDNFWNHKGVDYFGIARAFLVNFKEGRLVQGGSTITQQLAKSLLLSKERKISRKVKDFLLAQKIEEKFSKEDILFLYLNQVYLGGGYYGVKAAFRGYFDKDLKDATVAESALVAGLLVAPGRYSPYVNPRYAKRRQLYVLERMYKTGKIKEDQYEAAKKEEIKMRLREATAMKGGHFTDWVRQQVMDKVGAEEFLTEGFEVVTTLDWDLQKQAEEAVMKHVKELDKRQGFKGPLGNISDVDSTVLELQRQRQQIYRQASTYFHFTIDGENKFEFQASDGDWEESQNHFKEQGEKLNARFTNTVVIGNGADDKLAVLLKKGKAYQAVVLKTDDAQRMVYASIGGVRVMIPESGFSWAHERKLDEEQRWFAPVTKPSTILKAGDQILVRITGESAPVWNSLGADFKKKNKDAALMKVFQQQKFTVAELDQVPEAEGALVALNPQNGNIISMVGGIDFGKSQFNRAIQAARQPGSAFKPFIYAAALEHGYTPSTMILDTPQALGGVDDSLSWKPRNYDGEFMGQMTFRKALEISRNIPTIRILQDVGVNEVKKFTERFGMHATLPNDMSIGLGSFSVSLAELVKGYAVFANGGKKVSLHSVSSIKDRNGKTYQLETNLPVVTAPKPTTLTDPPAEEPVAETTTNVWQQGLTSTQVYDPRLAYIMSNILKGVVQNGTASAARGLSSHIAGKTGTTNNFVDALFVGYSSTVVAGTWVGLDNNKPMGYGEAGGKTALPIWIDYMRPALGKFGAPEFHVPEGILNVAVSRETGRTALPGEGDTFMESFAVGMDPNSSPSSMSVHNGDDSTPANNAPLDDGGYYNQQ